MAFQQPTPGRPIARGSKPYIWVTWLAKALAGGSCLYAPWFKAHFRYAKFEEEADKLPEWNREHTALMRARIAELEANGWTVTTEAQNDFKMEGSAAIVAGKPDAVATLGKHVLVIDGKTGRERESDFWQVFLYLYRWHHELNDPSLDLRGLVAYKSGADRELQSRDLSPQNIGEMVKLIKVIAGPDAPAKAPSRQECRRCNVGPKDCPQRVMADQDVTTPVSGF